MPIFYVFGSSPITLHIEMDRFRRVLVQYIQPLHLLLRQFRKGDLMCGPSHQIPQIIASLLTQYLPAKAVKLMPNGLLLGWCQLQESVHLPPEPWEAAF